MQGCTVSGTHVFKDIEIDDLSGETHETVYVSDCKFKDAALTRYRCAKMTALFIKMMYKNNIPSDTRIGFIGTGRTNIANCIAIKNEFGINDVVVRGSSRNFAKNIGDFMTICDNVSIDTSDDFHLLNSCKIVIVCTSSANKSECINADLLKNVQLIIALDCGYYLDETFRKTRLNYCDWPKQLSNHYNDEFPFDENVYQFKSIDCDWDGSNAVVYLYGVAIADAVAGEKMIRLVEKDKMEKPFLVR